MAKTGSLATYKAKRNFQVTPEPAEGGEAVPAGLQFVVQKHWATRLHYDFRLELDGTMKSWAVPKGPSYDTADKRMAIHVEDHPISYNAFEGRIPPKQYGAGKVMIWDKGIWVPIGDPRKGYAEGHLKFELRGHKLRGKWALVRIRGKDEKQDAWLLLKERDAFVRPAGEFSVVDEMPDSVAGLPPPAGAADPQPVASLALEGAVKNALPAKIAPQLATLVDAAPSASGDWIVEIKFDGYRMLARVEADGVRLFTSSGLDWTRKLAHLARDLAAMKLPPCWLDGEIVILSDDGLPDFEALQNAFDSAKTGDITYFIFDLMHLGGLDLRRVPLVQRRARLSELLADAPNSLRFSDAFAGAPRDVLQSACKLGLEGIICKRKDSPYTSTRSTDWIKLKCLQRQEFVVGGWTFPQDAKTGIGALLVGVHDEAGALLYSGRVGSGLSASFVAMLRARLDPLAASASPFKGVVEGAHGVQWVKPELVAELSFADWTRAGHIRAAVFHGLREDKPAGAVVRERPRHLRAAANAEVQHTLPARFRVTHPERVIDPDTGITKIELVRFYGLVGPLILEHLKGRPVSLVRAPSGVAGELFFQKHLEGREIPGVRQLDPALHPGHAPLLEVATVQGLISAAQLNVVEFHTWNAGKRTIARPDRMMFDLDPGEGVAWAQVQQAAELLRVLLNELGLVSFVKTSGGKGLHVVVPLRRLLDWDAVKDFSRAIALHLARTLPQIFVATSGPVNRVGRIFVDYLRNGFGATTASAWSARARPGLGVSVPIEWQEVAKIQGGAHWNVRNIHTRLDTGNGPWKDYAKSAQSLGQAMRLLGVGG